MNKQTTYWENICKTYILLHMLLLRIYKVIQSEIGEKQPNFSKWAIKVVSEKRYKNVQ